MSLEEEIEEEIRFHLEMRVQANLEAGMSPEEARADAERRFGDPDQVRKAGREYLRPLQGNDLRSRTVLGLAGKRATLFQAVSGWLAMLRDDLVHGARALVRQPLITTAAVLSLALGIGANTANFSIVYGVLFRDLPFEDSERLRYIDAWHPDRGDGDAPLTWADLEALRGSGAFDGLEAFDTRDFTLSGETQPQRVAGASVTPGLFKMMGVSPQRGRLFSPEEGSESDLEQVALLSDGLWRRSFAADPDLVGGTIRLNGRELTVVGIMEPGFRFPEREDIWLPLGTNEPTDHRHRHLIGVGRLGTGQLTSTAQVAADRWSTRAASTFPQTHEGWTLRVQEFRHGWIDAPARQLMALLLAAVGLVLLLACANVANLLLARSSDRRQELAIRNALGASRSRLAHEVLVESALLGLTGGALGIAVARFWVGSFGNAIPEELTFWIRVAIDRPVLLYAIAISLGTSFLFGLLPALQASSAGLGNAMRHASRGILTGRGRARAGLVIFEVTLSVILLVSASLMVQSFLELQRADPGFDDSAILSLRLFKAGDQSSDSSTRAEYYKQIEDRLSAIPGVAASVVTTAIPADDGGSAVRVGTEGLTEEETFYATAIGSGPGLFPTLGVELLAGRGFFPAEVADPEAEVALVGQGLAQRLWPGVDPLERLVFLSGSEAFRVIGVVPDLQYEEFGEDTEGSQLQLHLPLGVWNSRDMAVLVRAAGDPSELPVSVAEELRRFDSDLALFDILTMRDRRSLTTWPQRLFGNSFAVFAIVALILAVCGIYGVVAYSVARQTREIGIRIALGARPARIRFKVVGSALALAGIGAGLGLLGALAFAQGLRGALFGVSTTDPHAFVTVVLGLLVTAAGASWIPARRAAQIDPTEALRSD